MFRKDKQNLPKLSKFLFDLFSMLLSYTEELLLTVTIGIGTMAVDRIDGNDMVNMNNNKF